MVLGLTTARELGLAAVAIVFIAFALTSSFLVPTRNRNFPGRGLPWFLVGVVLLFAAMITAVLVIAREAPGKRGSELNPQTESQPQTQTGTQTQTQAQPPVQGDPVAGKQVFQSAGCTACHTLSAAGSTGTVGPNLDQKKPDYALIVTRVTNGKSPMPAFKGQLTDEQIHDVAAFVYTSTH